MKVKAMTFKNNLKFIGWTIIWALLPFLVFIISVITSFQKNGSVKLETEALSLFTLLVFILFITVPGFLIHLRYYLRDKGKTLNFHSTYLEISQNSIIKKVYYNEILKIERHYLWWSHKLPWSNYSHIDIILKDNTKLFYSCLIQDSFSSLSWFKSKNVAIEDCEEFYLT